MSHPVLYLRNFEILYEQHSQFLFHHSCIMGGAAVMVEHKHEMVLSQCNIRICKLSSMIQMKMVDSKYTTDRL